MKRIIRLKKIKKIKYNTKNYFKKKKSNRKCTFWIKKIKQIESPHNTNEYLIKNNSSPFFDDDEEESIIIKPFTLIKFEEDLKKEDLNLTAYKEQETSDEKSILCKSEQEIVKFKKIGKNIKCSIVLVFQRYFDNDNE